MSERDIDKAKAIAAIFGGLASIGAGIAGACGYVLAAGFFGFFLIVAGVVLAINTRGN